MIRVKEKDKKIQGVRKAISRGLILMLIALFVCLSPGYSALGEGETGGTGGTGTGESGGTGGTGGTGTGGTGGDSSGQSSESGKKLKVSIETLRLTGTSTSVILSSENGNGVLYYLLEKKASESAPSAQEIKSKGKKSRDGFISMAPLEENVEYMFYAVAEDNLGNISDVVSKRGVSSASRGIEIAGHVYCTLQVRDDIDDYVNEPGEITLNVGSVKNVKKIEYIIADRFVNSEGMIEKIANTKQDVTTAAGTSEITLSTWSEYDPNEKPGLVRDMLNYVYVKMTDEDGNVTYISSAGIWEDETEPTAGVTANADEMTAVVTVTGDDEESGVKKYYFMYRDPIDLSAVEPEDVKSKGISTDDGIFELSGLAKSTRYDLFAVVEDNAGNLSTVAYGSLTTSGEPEASSIRPSSDTSGNPGTTSNVSKRTEGVSLEDEEVNPNVPELTPFLTGSDEKGSSGVIKIIGWENLGIVAKNTAEPGNIYINMNGAVVVPQDFWEKVSGRNITCHFIMDDTITWVINGRGIINAPTSIDLTVSRKPGNIPAKLINDLAGVYPREEFTVDHHGTFDFTPTLKVKLGAENEDRNAYLYSYNKNDYRLELLSTVVVDDQGRASFALPDISDYVVIVGQVEGETVTEEDTEEITGEKQETKANEFVNSPKSSGKLWVVIVTVVALLLFGFILFMPKRKANEEGPESDGEPDGESDTPDEDE